MDDVAARNGESSSSRTSPLPQTDTTKGPVRKQNVACDGCRSKKVRCQRTTIQESCAQCVNKKVECTSNYIENLQSKTKKPRRKSEFPTHDLSQVNRDQYAQKRSNEIVDNGEAKRSRTHQIPVSSYRSNPTEEMYISSMRDHDMNHSHVPDHSTNPMKLASSTRYTNLLRYLFSVRPVMHHEFGYSDVSAMEQSQAGYTDLWEEDNGKVWSEESSQAHGGLSEESIREMADELIEVYFNIAHPRFPFFDINAFHSRLADPDNHPDGPVSPALVAVMIAFGARFADHPNIQADRREFTERDNMAYGPGVRPPRSRLVQLLIIRAREVMEACKVHRIRKLENVITLCVSEALFGQAPFLRDNYIPYNTQAAVKHIMVLGYQDPDRLMALKDPKERSSAVFAWFSICISDGYRSVFNRLSSSLNEMYYCTPPEVPARTVTGDNEQEQAVLWYAAASTGSAICRKMAKDLWSTTVAKEGLERSKLEEFVRAWEDWRGSGLAKLGFVGEISPSWDFLTAINAVGTDLYYQTLWVIIQRAIEEFGIKDEASEPIAAQAIRKGIADRAEHGVTRISSVVSVLTSNNYLRLDPYILHDPICEAAKYLAKRGRQECETCIAGLRQYSIAYPGFWDLAADIEKTYHACRSLVPSTNSTPQLYSNTTGTSSGINSTSSTGEVLGNQTGVVHGPIAMPHTLDDLSQTVWGSKENGSMFLTSDLGSNTSDLSLALFDWLQQS